MAEANQDSFSGPNQMGLAEDLEASKNSMADISESP